MKNQKSASTSIMLNYGLILGFASIFIAVANFAFGDVYKPHWGMQVVSAAATIIIIVYGLKKIKENNEGFLSLGESLKTGLGIALISGIVFVVYFFVFTNYIEPEYYTNSEKVAEATILETYPTWSDEQVEAAVAMSKKMQGFGMMSAIVMIMSLFFGFIVSLIAGLIMKRVPEED
jgi:hypothetical protein